jgi:hypothetical protein
MVVGSRSSRSGSVIGSDFSSLTPPLPGCLRCGAARRPSRGLCRCGKRNAAHPALAADPVSVAIEAVRVVRVGRQEMESLVGDIAAVDVRGRAAGFTLS